jgi:hypothetical protein
MDELLAIAPPDYPLLAAKEKVSAKDLYEQTRGWLSL